MSISSKKIEEIRSEIENNKKVYLENCRLNYSEYVDAAQILFPNTYNKMDSIDKESQHLFDHVTKSLEHKKENNIEDEINELLKVVEQNNYTPYPYERLSILYSKKKDLHSSYKVCKKWFDSEYWMIPNMSTSSLRILYRLEKLKTKLNL